MAGAAAARSRRGAVAMGLSMISAFTLGFALVFLLTDRGENRPPASDVVTTLSTGASSVAGSAPAEEEEETETDTAVENDADLPPEVPPGRTPDGIMVTGVLYLKCFDSNGTMYKTDACGELSILERRFSSRLYVVHKCAREIAGETPEGLLSLGVNVDFAQKEIGFWAGPSSEIEGAKQIGSCVRRELAGLPIYDIDAKYARYRLFFSVSFDDPMKLAQKIKKLKRRGRTVRVVLDHVHIRRAPEDGYAFGKLSSDSEVTLVNRKDDWCRVITPNDNEGWIICEALDV